MNIKNIRSAIVSLGFVAGLTLSMTFFVFAPVAVHEAHAATAPEKMTIFSAFALNDGNGGVQFTWVAPADGGSAITQYDVRYRSYQSGDWITFSPSTPTDTTVTVSELASNVIYEFQVAAENSIGSGEFSDSVEFAADLTVTYADVSFYPILNDSSKFSDINVFSTIQDAIDAVDDQGTVNVAPGVYAAHLTLGRGITLNGEGFLTSPSDGAILLDPDCDTALTITGYSFVQNMIIDGNDGDHACTDPTVMIAPDSLLQSLGVVIENSNTAIEASPGTEALMFYTDFINLGTAIQSDSTTSFFYIPFASWDSETGPYNALMNPEGTGAAITGDGQLTVNFRPYITTDLFTFGPLDDLGTIAPEDISSLFTNGGTFTPFNYNSGGNLSPHDVSMLYVNEAIHIEVPTATQPYAIDISGEPGMGGPGMNFVEHDGDDFDATEISASIVASSSASNVPHGAQIIGSVLQWGIPGTQLDVVDGPPVQIGLYVGPAYENQALIIFRSESLSGDWTQEGRTDIVRSPRTASRISWQWKFPMRTKSSTRTVKPETMTPATVRSVLRTRHSARHIIMRYPARYSI
jgi:Fibronectin type III domain